MPDAILLEKLCSEEDDALLYAEFSKRFLPDLEKECAEICKGRKLHPHIGRQIAHDTLEKVRKYKKFRIDQVVVNDAHKGILVYLFRISINLFNDYHRKTKASQDQVFHKTYFENILESATISDTFELKEKKDFALKLFKALNTKEQKVILTDIEYKKFHKYLPDDVNQRLAEELGVKSSSIRKIRERAIAKLQNLINEAGKA